MRVYNQWAGDPKGIEEDITRCAVTVYGRYQCQRRRGHGPGGILCAQHAKRLAEGKDVSIPKETGEVMKVNGRA